MAWRQTPLLNRNLLSLLSSNPNTSIARFSSKANLYPVKVGIPEFLNGIGNGVETYAEKLESEFGDLQNLLVARSMKLKKLNVGGDPKVCKHRKLILKYAHKAISTGWDFGGLESNLQKPINETFQNIVFFAGTWKSSIRDQFRH